MRDFTRKKVEAGALAIACILHAVAWSAIRVRSAVAVAVPRAQDDADSLTVVEMEERTATATATSTGTSTSTSTSTATATATATSTATSTATATATSTGTSTSTASTTSGEGIAPIDSSRLGDVRPFGSGEPWTFLPTGEVNLGLGDKTGALARQMAVHGTLDTGTTPSAGRVVESLDAADLARGFGRGGPVVQAVEEVAHDPTAPPEGVAMFDIAIEKNGKVSVSVSESTANREDWQRLTGDIARAVEKKSIRMPEGANGLRVGVRVEAKIRFPDGRDPKKSGAYASGTGLGVHDNHDGTASVELPSVGVGVRGKVCSADLRLSLLGPTLAGGCSPENIGTHAERTVGAAETYEKRM